MPSILITGANRGLGLEFVRQYRDAGWSVTATCRQPSQAMALQALQTELLPLDVGDDRSIAALGRQLSGRPFDLLLNNAGIYGGAQDLGRLESDIWLQVMRVNALGPILLAQTLLPNILAGDRKQMLFLTSRMGSIADNGGGGTYIYRSSKAALNAAVKSLSLDLAPRGVTALLLHPGWAQTAMGGPAATLPAADSVAGMRRVIDQLTPGPLRFVDYRGTAIPW